MEVTLSGMVMLVSEVQLENAELPIEVTLLGMVMLVSEVQLENAELPMEVTPSGMVMLVSERHLENASLPMEVTLPSEGITLFLQPAISVLLAVSIRRSPEL